jgi:hypothetical protein
LLFNAAAAGMAPAFNAAAAAGMIIAASPAPVAGPTSGPLRIRAQ